MTVNRSAYSWSLHVTSFGVPYKSDFYPMASKLNVPVHKAETELPL